jgi:hypothetical protein
MLPSNSWSTDPHYSQFLPPHDSPQVDRLVSRDAGPIAVGDSSQGLRARIWTARYAGGVVSLDGHGDLFAQAGITEISLTFDQNGRPIIAFTAAGSVFVWWFDTLTSDNEIVTIAVGDQPFVHLDERRPQFSSGADAILIYRRDGSIYYRRQRDRFLTELATPITDAAAVAIESFGMTVGNRLQIQFRAGQL